MSLQLNMTINRASTEYQHSINDLGQRIVYNLNGVLQCFPLTEVLTAVMGNIVHVDVATPKNDRQNSINRGSTVCERSWVLNVI
jgi:hypothetical protein